MAHWLEERDEPDTWSYEGEVELETPGAAVIRVSRRTPRVRRRATTNVWLVRFDDDGRASEFQDWWFQRKE